MTKDEPRVIKGGLGIDDRGEVGFVNDFDFQNVKRFYTLKNYRAGFVRAWHGHKKEGKFLHVSKGSAIIAAVQIDNWESPSKDLPIARYVVSEKQPSVLYIPPGYANGTMSLEDDTRIIIFSTSTLEESKGDDFRFHGRYWNPWEVEER
jgi:dTDP-4-dehydrorhamnose 3,5-epimerase-like enzyme